MKVKWFAHASVLLEGDGVRIITDPYTPEVLGFLPITEPADIVVRSSADDDGHNHAEMIAGSPVVVTATELEPEGATVRGIHFVPIHAQESLIYKERPRDNAMYLFTLDGIRIAHLGDIGNRITDDQLALLSGVDVLFAPAGGPPTIDLTDLADAVRTVKPRIMIPVHFGLPNTKVKMLPVTEFAKQFPPDRVVYEPSPEIEITRENLPDETRIVVLQASTLRASSVN
jgi:L-ascorbate metabolism protein UlaG (beta-lactamase superfamily)